MRRKGKCSLKGKIKEGDFLRMIPEQAERIRLTAYGDLGWEERWLYSAPLNFSGGDCIEVHAVRRGYAKGYEVRVDPVPSSVFPDVLPCWVDYSTYFQGKSRKRRKRRI
jgi:hypothetical protein